MDDSHPTKCAESEIDKQYGEIMHSTANSLWLIVHKIGNVIVYHSCIQSKRDEDASAASSYSVSSAAANCLYADYSVYKIMCACIEHHAKIWIAPQVLYKCSRVLPNGLSSYVF